MSEDFPNRADVDSGYSPSSEHDEDTIAMIEQHELHSAINVLMANVNALHQRLDAENVHGRLLALEEKLTVVLTQVERVMNGIEPHIPEVEAMIESIGNNPMFKMFLGTKSKR